MSVEQYLTYIIMPILALSVLLVFIRFFKGPAVVDRVVALDLTISIGVAIIAVYSMIANNSAFLDDAMILALIAFLGTVAFAYYLAVRVKK
ncbi:MAG TPA: monovalent cation/H+ antiporter complex subunit F [Chitinophagaceae bacterium]|nr:monovalent cation/H+ antiporter complex subunit F [Chitinophagaceae bacterium]